MTEAFEGNGEYPNYGDGSSDFKRSKRGQDLSADEDSEEKAPNEKAAEYIRELLNERVQIDRKYPICDRLIEQEVQKVQLSGKIPPRENRYVDIYREKQIRVNVKVLVPVKEHPKFNFVGKLLGPKGNSMKRLQEDTMCKMAVLGRGSMKDRKREEELRASLEPKYAHLNDDLHVEISALAPPAEAHARIAYALAEVRKYLIPDSNDNIRREQIRELMSDGNPVHEIEVPEPRVIPPPRPPPVPTYYRAAPTPAPPPRNPSTRTVMPAKQKIMSILDRARSAMEESYGPPPTSARQYEEAVFEEPYEGYTYSHTHHATAIPSRPRYEIPEYEGSDYTRRPYYRASPTLKSSGSAPRASWKTSSGYGSSRAHEETSSKHHHSHASRERYRSSPYQTSRPSK